MENRNNLIKTTCYICSKSINKNLQDILTCETCKRIFHYICIFKSILIKDEFKSKEFKCIICSIQDLNPFIKNIALYGSPIIVKSEKSSKKFQIRYDIQPEFKLNTRIDKIYNFFLYSTKVTKDLKLFQELIWPNEPVIIINGKKITNLVQGQGYNISSHIEISNTVSIELDILDSLGIKYMFIIIGGSSIKQSEVELKENRLSLNDYKLLQIRLFEDNMIIEEKITVKDVITQKLISRPVRSYSCTHFQCFDFQTYIKMCFIKKTCYCPICKNFASFSNLCEDLFFKNLIEEFISNNEYENLELFLKQDGKTLN
jgi:hypothetical protein